MKIYLPLFIALVFACFYATGQSILGVDVSHYDSDPPYGVDNWSLVKGDGKKFAWAKATEGVNFTDTSFVTNMRNGTPAGVIMGAYHFALPETNANAADEANYFLSVASPYIGPGYLPPVLDLEDPNGTPLSNVFTSAQLTAWVQTWFTTVQNATGVAPVLYTDGNYAGYLESSLNTYGLWIADPDTNLNPPTNIGVWTTWAFKQYSWIGTVPGIGGHSSSQVDLDLFNGDSVAFNTLVGLNPITAKFTANLQMVCAGSSVNFTDQSSSTGTITGYRWTFPGGTPDTSSAKNPTVVYDSSGTYNVKEVVTSTTGTDSVTATGYITVASVNSLPLVETFQSPVFPPPGWTMHYPQQGDSAWELCTYTGYSSSQCMYFPANCGYVTSIAGERQEIYTPDYSFVGASNPEMWFDVAYEPYNKTYSDTLAIYYSTDCGTTWTLIYLKGGMTLCTTASTDSAGTDTSGGNGCFIPPNTHAWRTDSINLSSLTGDANVMFSFESRSGWGNILYIDNINVASLGTVCVPPSAPTIQASPGTTNCGPIQLTASSNGCNSCTYAWSNLSTGSGISVSTTGTYSVTASSGGCSSQPTSITVTINQPPTVSVSASSQQVCINQPVTLTATGNATSYQWSGAGLQSSTGNMVSAVVSTSGSQTYTVTASLNGCTATASTSVNFNTTVVPVINISQTTANPICTGAQVSFSSNISNGGTNPVYQWIAGIQTGNGSSFTLNNATNGNAVKCLLISDAGCANPDSVYSNTLTVSTTAPQTVTLSISTPDTNVCSGENMGFTSSSTNAGANPTYQWFVNGSQEGTASTYTLNNIQSNSVVYCVITSAAACITNSPDTSNTLSVHISNSVQASVSIAPSANPVCSGDYVTFIATPGNGGNSPAYSWFLNGAPVGADSADYINTQLHNGDSVSCSMTSSAGCVANPDVVSNTLVMQVDSLEVPGVQLAYCDFTAQYFPAVSYQWFLQGSAISGANTRFYSVVQSGNYFVRVNDTSGCTAQSISVYASYPGCLPAGIDDLSDEPDFEVYPNPVSDEVTLDFVKNIAGSTRIEILDICGQVVYLCSGISATPGLEFVISTAQLAAGTYLLRIIREEGKTGVRKVVKMQ